MKSNIDFVLESVIDELAVSLQGDEDTDQEYVVWVDCPYAEYIEFGSDPYNGGHTPRKYDPADRKRITEVNFNIRDWAQTKFGLNDKARCKIGDKIYHSIMDSGIPPQPFIRPAISYVEQLFESDPDMFLDDPEPTKRMAEEMVRRMYELLDRSNTTTTGALKAAIHFGPASAAPTDSFDSESAKEIPEEVWADDKVDRHNVYRPNHMDL